jgi:hypothetical protein
LPAIGLGTRFQAHMGKAGMEMLVELTEFDRPRRLGSRTTSSIMVTTGTREVWCRTGSYAPLSHSGHAVNMQLILGCVVWPDGRFRGCSLSVRVRGSAFITC